MRPLSGAFGRPPGDGIVSLLRGKKLDVSANSIRDTIIQSLTVTYDWDGETHVADLRVLSGDGVVNTFRIAGLSRLEISEDFTSRYVAFCTLIRSPGRIYLSLDPYQEGIESDHDNFSFVGQEITQI
jgi:hypothetical protein